MTLKANKMFKFKDNKHIMLKNQKKLLTGKILRDLSSNPWNRNKNLHLIGAKLA